MKKVILVTATVMLSIGIAYAKPVKDKEPMRIIINAGSKTITMQGQEYTLEEVRAKFPAVKEAVKKANTEAFGDVEIEFPEKTEGCAINLHTLEGSCKFTFLVYAHLKDFELPFYPADKAAKDYVVAYTNAFADDDWEKQEYIDFINTRLDAMPGAGIFVTLVYQYNSLTEDSVTEYGKENKYVLPSLYTSGYYLLRPGEYMNIMNVETESGNKYDFENPFKVDYYPMPDPKGMFDNVGIKGADAKGSVIEAIPGTNAYKSKAYRLELIDVLGRTLKYVEGPEKPLTIEEAGAYYLRA
jgi:hypothetical protein